MMRDNAVRASYSNIKRITITEMSRIYNVSLRTLRFYEERGLLTPTRAGMIRLYSPRDRIKLQVILSGKKLGFSLREIDLMLQSHVSAPQAEPDQMWTLLDASIIENQIATLSRRKAEVEASLEELKAALR